MVTPFRDYVVEAGLEGATPEEQKRLYEQYLKNVRQSQRVQEIAQLEKQAVYDRLPLEVRETLPYRLEKGRYIWRAKKPKTLAERYPQGLP